MNYIFSLLMIQNTISRFQVEMKWVQTIYENQAEQLQVTKKEVIIIDKLNPSNIIAHNKSIKNRKNNSKNENVKIFNSWAQKSIGQNLKYV